MQSRLCDMAQLDWLSLGSYVFTKSRNVLTSSLSSTALVRSARNLRDSILAGFTDKCWSPTPACPGQNRRYSILCPCLPLSDLKGRRGPSRPYEAHDGYLCSPPLPLIHCANSLHLASGNWCEVSDPTINFRPQGLRRVPSNLSVTFWCTLSA